MSTSAYGIASTGGDDVETFDKVVKGYDQARCPRLPHNDPTTWAFSADRYNRPGYRTVHCRECGAFIGYQPPEVA